GLNGVGTGENHDYASSPSGNITLSGSADLALSFWEWDGSGTLAIKADAPITFAYWRWEPTGGFIASDKVNPKGVLSLPAGGGFSTADSSAFGPSDYLPFIVDASGVIGFTGLAFAAPGQ